MNENIKPFAELGDLEDEVGDRGCCAMPCPSLPDTHCVHMACLTER